MRNRVSQHHPPSQDGVALELSDEGSHQPSRPISSHIVRQRNILLVSCCLLLLYIGCGRWGSVMVTPETCLISLGTYLGPQYNSPESGTIGKPTCLVESKWLKLSQHSVRFPGSETTFDDWMWIDYHDRINVLVEAPNSNVEERHFLVFHQSKYALEGRTSTAIIGGVIEPGESPEAAARREVDEEMEGLVCEKFHALGRYRTDVNRGMGWLHSFLATKCTYEPNHGKHLALENEVGAADTEQQSMATITLSELRESVLNGEFIEVQWSATVALALLHPELAE